MHIPYTSQRVSQHTAPRLARRIKLRTDRNIQYYARHPERIDKRLSELDREWDIERTLEANAAALSVASVLMGAFVNRKWFFLPGIVGGFLLQHAIQGWCPPLPIFRRMGVRTQPEIARERYALKALRDDS